MTMLILKLNVIDIYLMGLSIDQQLQLSLKLLILTCMVDHSGKL